MNIDCVAIIGLGLVGGSLARDLARLGVRVIGHDTDPATLRAAREGGVLADALAEELRGAEHADIIVVATPVQHATAVLRRIAALPTGSVRLITDVGSTKQSVVRAAGELGLGARFVGGHPLAGSHRAGWSSSRSGSFAGAPVYLCMGAEATMAAQALAHVLWQAVGAQPVVTDAGAHDERLAVTSHLPQVLSSALARVLSGAGATASELGPGGRDMTRLAGSAPGTWTGIACDNAAPLSHAIDQALAELTRFRDALRAGNAAAVRMWFEEASQWSELAAAGEAAAGEAEASGGGAKPAPG
jgi:prephenate dehydrogenase